jgi:hypothetical protein
MKKRGELKDGHPVTIWLEQETIDAAERLAEKADMARGRLLRNIIETNIKSLEYSDKLGFVQFSVLLRDLGDTVKAWAQGCKDEPENIGVCSQ